MIRVYAAKGEDRILDDDARAAARGSFVTLSGGVTHYELAGPGDGPLVLLVPGITIPLGYWDEVAADLHAGGLRTLAYSAYGRGWSDRVEGPYDQALFLRQLDELVAAVGAPEPLHLVGTSMGGLLAMAYATRDSAVTPSSMTLIGPAGLTEPSRLVTRLLSIDPPARLLGTFFGRRALGKHLAHNVRSSDDADRLVRLVGEPYRFHGSIHALLSTLRTSARRAARALPAGRPVAHSHDGVVGPARSSHPDRASRHRPGPSASRRVPRDRRLRAHGPVRGPPRHSAPAHHLRPATTGGRLT